MQIIQWLYWWTQFTLLQLIRGIGVIWYPVYVHFLVVLDVSIKVTRRNRSKRIRKIQSRNEKYFILPLAGKLCVFTDAFNVHAEDLAFLANPLHKYDETYFYQLKQKWQEYRISIGYFPPVDGLPMKIAMSIFPVISIFVSVAIGIKRIRMEKQKQQQNPNNTQRKIFHTNNRTQSAFMRSETFDGDADTIIVDNSANCIIWRYKKNFVKSTYRKLDSTTRLNIETASGGWYWRFKYRMVRRQWKVP